MSRTEFDARLAKLPHVETAEPPELYLAFAPSGERFLPGSFVEAWFETLVRTDMGVEASKELAGEIRNSFFSRVVEQEQILAFLKEKLKALQG